MGENEQGGMLRNVVVVGLVAMVALIVIFAVVGLKGNMTSTTNGATDNIQKNIKKANDSDDTNVATDDFTTSKYYYSDPDANGMVTLTGVHADQRATLSGNVIIPTYLQRDGKKYTINKIDSYAFSSTNMTSVVIPATIESIGDDAFYNTKLTSVTIPDGVKTIGQQAFDSIPANKDGFASIGKNTTYSTDSWHSSFGTYWNNGVQISYKPTIRG